jgi:hypothetical protein
MMVLIKHDISDILGGRSDPNTENVLKQRDVREIWKAEEAT